MGEPHSTFMAEVFCDGAITLAIIETFDVLKYRLPVEGHGVACGYGAAFGLCRLDKLVAGAAEFLFFNAQTIEVIGTTGNAVTAPL